MSMYTTRKNVDSGMLMKKFMNELTVTFRETGFVKKASSWYLSRNQVIVVVNLQSSAWANQYYLNVGFWLLGLGEVQFPKYNRCHFYARAEGLFPEERETIRQGLSLDDGDDKDRANLVRFAKDVLVPFLLQCADENKLRQMLSAGVFEVGILTEEARIYLLSRTP